MLKKLNEKNMLISNVSISIEAKKPNLEQHTNKIKESLSDILKIEVEDIGITCTSGDGLTSFGHGKGIQCFVSAALINN